MRKRVAQNSGDFWTQLPQDGREQIKAKLPELILPGPTAVVGSLVLSCRAHRTHHVQQPSTPLGSSGHCCFCHNRNPNWHLVSTPPILTPNLHVPASSTP